MGIGKRILSVLIGILFIISVSVLEEVCLAKQVLVKAISQAGIDTAISHRMMDAVFGYAGADDTQWIAKIQNKIEKKRRSTENYTKGHERDNRGSFQRKSVQRRRCNKRTESDSG